ncbi:hypothetical protein [Pseudaminobacter sp. NGMCC 1.201702]|uniref:hypothetical protein n=1 Tax=Pseudaminobacter sp. NGMCC 1.201702 TaxID=3391825 RepID=UPI0039F08DEB
MSSPTAFDAIHDHLVARWAATDLVFENEDYQLPDVPAHFVYVEVFGDLLEQDTFGAPQNNEWLETGQVYLHVMTPNGTGSGEARTLARDLSYLFREQPLGSMHFREMSIGMGEPAKTFGNYFAMTLSITFDRRDVTVLP